MGFSESLESLKASGIEGIETHLTEIVNHVESLKQESIGHRRKASEIEGKYNPLLKTLSDNGFDTAQDITAQIAKLKASPSSGTDETKRELAALRGQLDEFKKSAEEKDAALRRETATNFFSKTFNDSQFIGGDMFLKGLMLSGEIGVDKDNKPFVKIGDEYLPPDTGITKLIDSNPSIKAAKKNTQNAGGGTTGAGGGTSKTKPLAEFNRMGAKEKAAFMDAGGTII